MIIIYILLSTGAVGAFIVLALHCALAPRIQLPFYGDDSSPAYADGAEWARAELHSGRMTPEEVGYHLDGAPSQEFYCGALDAAANFTVTQRNDRT